MIKQIIKTLLLFLILIPSVFADTNLNLKTSENEVFLDDNFSLTLSINTDERLIPEPVITWLEKFNILSKWSSSSFTSINWVTSVKFDINLVLSWKTEWKFNIWPAKVLIWSWEVVSNIVSIEVIWYNILINNDIKDNKIEKDNKNTEIKDQELKPNSKTLIFWNQYFIYFFFLLILLIFIFYYILDKFLSYKQEKQILEKPQISEKSLIIKELKYLDKISEWFNKWEFYEKLNVLFRRYLVFTWIKSALKLTFNEIEEYEKTIDSKLFNLFKDSYYSEFSSEDDNKEKRKDIIKKLIKIIW